MFHLDKFLFRSLPLIYPVRNHQCCVAQKPQHLICFKQWTAEMVLEILYSALNLKRMCSDTHNQKLSLLNGSKVMILQEVNEPMLNMAVSKAATFLGASDVGIVDQVVWHHDYNGRVFSIMSDAIFVATSTHHCIQRFADQSSVPVICMRSRTHASIQSLATIMAIMEEFGAMDCLNLSYLGPPHPVLNSYLLLCPMLGANIRFKCCCDKEPVSPLLFKASEDMCEKTFTESKECKTREEVLQNAMIVISGPSPRKEKEKHFKLSVSDICKHSPYCNWIFFHTCPRGTEVDDDLFNHWQSRTFGAFTNMQYIAAALMANSIKGHRF